MTIPAKTTAAEDPIRAYLLSLKVGERVIETGQSMTTGWTGVTFMSEVKGHGMCVRWDQEIDGGHMSTAVTWGTRRIEEVLARFNEPAPSRVSGGAAERWFPIMRQSRYAGAAHPPRIPWSVAELAYSVYRNRYSNDQTLEVLAQRGGFAPGEMDDQLPDWRERCGELADLRARVEAAEKKCMEACGGSAPSAGHDIFDEVCGLLRAARSQRDDAWLAERQLLEKCATQATRLQAEAHHRMSLAEALGLAGDGDPGLDQLFRARAVHRAQPIVDRIRAIARVSGWAIGAHGTMSRDIDLIGVPWTAEACSADDLVERLKQGAGYHTFGHSLGAPRAGGRRSVLLFHAQAERMDPPHAKGNWNPPAVDLSLLDPRAVTLPGAKP